MDTKMVNAAPALPEIDERRLNNKFYRLVEIDPEYIALLNEAEDRIKNFLIKSYEATAAELNRVKDCVPPNLFREWCEARFGWSAETVRRIRDTLSQAETQLAAVREERNQLIIEMRNQGMTQQKVAAELGTSRELVKKVEGSLMIPSAISDSPLKGRPKASGTKLTPKQAQEIVEALANGESTKSLAKRFDCPPSTIKRTKQRVGLAPPKLLNKLTERSAVSHSLSNHSPSLSRLRTPGSPEAMCMEDHKIQFFKAVSLLLQDITKAEKRLGSLQNEIQEDFTRYHGAMLARWAAYEKVWAPDLIEVCGCETFDEVKQSLVVRIKKLETKAKNSLAILDRIKFTHITLEA